MNWYIGQRIVAITNHPQRVFKEGDEFNIKGIKGAECTCDFVELDVGINNVDRTGSSLFKKHCSSCGFAGQPTADPTWWFMSTRFVPLDEWREAEKAVKELLEPQKIEICI